MGESAVPVGIPACPLPGASIGIPLGLALKEIPGVPDGEKLRLLLGAKHGNPAGTILGVLLGTLPGCLLGPETGIWAVKSMGSPTGEPVGELSLAGEPLDTPVERSEGE